MLAKRAALLAQVLRLQDFQPATLEAITAVHDARFVDAFQRMVASEPYTLLESAPTYATASSFTDARKVGRAGIFACCGGVTVSLHALHSASRLATACDKHVTPVFNSPDLSVGGWLLHCL